MSDNLFQGTDFADRVKINEPLSVHTTLEVGGPADYYIEIDKADEIGEILRYARQINLSVFILGGGSNILIADSGWRGLVLRYTNRRLFFHDDDAIAEAAAGLPWDDFVIATIGRGLGGVECLSGVPGLVGASPVQNIGCYGQEAAETIITVEAIDMKDGSLHKFFNRDCGFEYRQSRFKTDNEYLITKVDFNLRRTNEGAVLYDEVGRALKEHNISQPTLSDVRGIIMKIRRRKSMLLDSSDPNSRSVGSFFINPIVDADIADGIEYTARSSSLLRAMPRWPTDGGQVKLSAAWLIESAGFQRGYVLGRAGISANHILAIINLGGATAIEIIDLAGRIRRRVRDMFGIMLEPEPRFVGFDKTTDNLLNESK